jgi:glycosyltransferase involved in cell wall biosynthesis
MRIAVLCRRLSDNTFVRSYLLLKTLTDVTIDVYGLVDNRGLHGYFDSEQFAFHTVSTEGYGDWAGEPSVSERLSRLSTQGVDAIRLWTHYAYKSPAPDTVVVASGWKGSVGAGLLAKHLGPWDVPVVVDIFDRTEWVDMLSFDPLSSFDATIASNRPLAEQVGGTTIHTPVDTDRFDPERFDRQATRSELGFRDEEFVAGFVGTPRKTKGIDALIGAVCGADDDVRGLIVGPTDNDYGEQLKKQANEDVVFVPPVPHSEVPRYYAALDALVLPQQRLPDSKYQFPAKLPEAMSMGTPVIATAVGDIPNAVDNAGILLDTPTSTAIRKGIGKLNDRSAGYSERVRARAIEMFSADVIGDSLSELLAELRGSD